MRGLRTYLKNISTSRFVQFCIVARREEEIVAPALHRRRATQPQCKIVKTRRDTADFSRFGVAPPRSIAVDTPSSSLLGSVEIGSYRGGRYFEIGSILLESIIAITVLTVGMLGMFALLSRSVGLTRVVSSQYVGAYLAAEGIELVRNMIDNNVLQSRPWNAGLASGAYEVTYNTSLEPDANRTLFYNTGTGLYDYASGDASTTFRRKIIIQRIGGAELKVNAQVSWLTRGGGEFGVDLEDHFFNNK